MAAETQTLNFGPECLLQMCLDPEYGILMGF
uniref:Uncharacterized protein n=1 Tax=Bos taurus TaxID=9913 RepID=A0ABI0P650_BOVIN